MKEDITEMLKCNAVYAMSNYHLSQGALLEINLAKALHISVIKEAECLNIINNLELGKTIV